MYSPIKNINDYSVYLENYLNVKVLSIFYWNSDYLLVAIEPCEKEYTEHLLVFFSLVIDFDFKDKKIVGLVKKQEF